MSSEVAQAKTLLRNEVNHYALKDPHIKTTGGILFNADNFFCVSHKHSWIRFESTTGTAVTTLCLFETTYISIDCACIGKRLRYLNFLNEKLLRDTTVFKPELYCLSIHQVRLLHLNRLERGTASPKTTATQVRLVGLMWWCTLINELCS